MRPPDPPGAASEARRLRRRFSEHRSGVVALFLLALLVAATFAASTLWRYGYADITSEFSSPPSWGHPFGTDSPGHDLLAQVVRGTQRSLFVGLVVAALATSVGVAVGTAAGLAGGWVDSLLMRLTDLLLALPAIAVLLVVGAAVAEGSGSAIWIAVTLAGLLWTRAARVVRAEVLTLRRAGFVEAARSVGAGSTRLVWRHLLPNAASVIIVTATLTVAVAILAEAALTYLGVGANPPETSLGRLVADGQAALTTRPWLFFFPSLVLVLLVTSLNFVGDALRQVLDPLSGTRPPRETPPTSPL